MDDVERILAYFDRRERWLRLKCRAMIAVGLPLSLLGAVTLASLFWLAAHASHQFGPAISGVRWIDLFVVFTAITVPLLFRLEIRTGGSYRADLSDGGMAPGRAYMLARSGVGLLAVAASNRRAISTTFVEFFLLGPRLVLGGFHQLKLARCVRLTDPAPAAGVVCTLLARDSGLETAALLPEGATIDRIMPALAYLAFYQWVGIGDQWVRVWLDSDARRLLIGDSPR